MSFIKKNKNDLLLLLKSLILSSIFCTVITIFMVNYFKAESVKVINTIPQITEWKPDYIFVGDIANGIIIYIVMIMIYNLTCTIIKSLAYKSTLIALINLLVSTILVGVMIYMPIANLGDEGLSFINILLPVLLAINILVFIFMRLFNLMINFIFKGKNNNNVSMYDDNDNEDNILPIEKSNESSQKKKINRRKAEIAYQRAYDKAYNEALSEIRSKNFI